VSEPDAITLGYSWPLKIMLWVGFAFGAWVAVIGVTYSKVDTVGTRVAIFLIGASLCALLVRAYFGPMRHPMVANSQGVSGLWVPSRPPRTTHKWLDRLWTRGAWIADVIPWDQIDHAAAEFIPGAQGGGSYGVFVYLHDGRRAKAPSGTLGQAAAGQKAEQIESIRSRFG
jgi:hypothetical protein